MKEKLERSRGRRGDLNNDQIRLIEPRRQRICSDSLAVSVIMVDSGSGGPLERSLEALGRQKFSNFETIIVCRDGIKEESLPARWPETIVLKSQHDLGFCRAGNLAAKIALGKYLLFMDSRAWLNRTALGNLVEVLESEPRAGIVGPLILDADRCLQSIGMNIDRFGQPIANREPFGPDAEIIDNVFFVPGSALMIEKQLFNSLGGFDEIYRHGLEDADICWRARLLGKKIIVNPWSIAYNDLDSKPDVQSYLNHRNSLRMLIKNYNASHALVAGANFFRATIVNSLKSLFSWKLRLFYQYWRAFVWNLVMLPDSIKQRRRVQRHRQLDDESVLKHVHIEKEPVENSISDRAA